MKSLSIVLIGVSLACGGGAGAQSTQGGTASAKTEKAAKAGASACDRLYKMVSECINTKVPHEERAKKLEEVEYSRNIVSSSPLASFIDPAKMESSCEENIRQEIQTDSYGCYAGQAAAVGIKTPCSYATRAEIQEALNSPVQEGQHDGSQCYYPPSGSGGRYAKIEVHWTHGRDELDAARTGVKILDKRMAKDDPNIDRKTILDGETVPGLGDDAFFMTAGFMPFLHVRKGDAAFSIEAFGSDREQMIAVARKILTRFP